MTLKTRIFTHHPRVSLARFTFCWWCHNPLAMMSQWPDNCDVDTWQVISNSLDIDFIHGDIHGRSCKKVSYIAYTKFHLPRPVFHSPSQIFTRIGKQASTSFPACIKKCDELMDERTNGQGHCCIHPPPTHTHFNSMTHSIVSISQSMRVLNLGGQ